MTPILIAAIVFVAALLQTLSGFGFSLILMPLITLLVGLRTAAPLVALAGLTSYTINIIRYRRLINGKEVLPLAGASALGIPIGIWALVNVDESIIKPVLGAVLIAYALFTLLRPTPVPLRSRRWVYLAGFLAGCLGGAYNTPGPPLVVYGALRQWPKHEFRAILQTLFFLNGILIVLSHTLAQNLTEKVLSFYVWTVPALILGIVAGALIDHKVNREQFHMLVSVLILATGLSLLIGLGSRS